MYGVLFFGSFIIFILLQNFHSDQDKVWPGSVGSSEGFGSSTTLHSSNAPLSEDSFLPSVQKYQL